MKNVFHRLDSLRYPDLAFLLQVPITPDQSRQQMLKPADLSAEAIPKRSTSDLIVLLSGGMIEFVWQEAGTPIDEVQAGAVRRLIAAEINRRVPIPT
jgi:hypothetical protein